MIEDAAQSLGGYVNGQHIGSHGIASAICQWLLPLRIRQEGGLVSRLPFIQSHVVVPLLITKTLLATILHLCNLFMCHATKFIWRHPIAEAEADTRTPNLHMSVTSLEMHKCFHSPKQKPSLASVSTLCAPLPSSNKSATQNCTVSPTFHENSKNCCVPLS